MTFSYKTMVVTCVGILLCGVSFAQEITRTQYINNYKHIAIRQMNQYGIPASIILAQGCLESGNGNSRLAIKANNHFGIKCHNWTGKRIYHNDDKKGECFRKYNTPEDSFKDHSEFLRNGKRYQSLFDLKKTDYKAWAHGLKAAGYATNPKYAQMLITIIEENQLYQYDSGISSLKESKQVEKERRTIEKQNKKAERAARKAEKQAAKEARKAEKAAKAMKNNAGLSVPIATVAGVTASVTATEIAKQENIPLPGENPVKANATNAVPLKNSSLYRYSLDRQIYTNNGTPYIIATGVETYESLAKEYNLFTRELLNFNDLRKECPIPTGTIVYIQKKKNQGEATAYVVQPGDTLYQISQKLGIKLLKLYELNDLKYGEEVEAGKILNLKTKSKR